MPARGYARRVRERLLAAVHTRVARFAAGDPGPVLAAEAEAEARALVAALPDGAVDVEGLLTAGRLYWCRHLAAGPGAGAADLDAALRLFRRLGPDRPEIPAQARPLLDGGEPDALSQAVALLEGYEDTGEPARLDAAIALLRQLVDVVPGRDPIRRTTLMSLGYALLLRYQRDGDELTLTGSLAAARQAMALAPPGDPDVPEHGSILVAALVAAIERSGAGDVLDEAAAVGRKLADALPAGHPDRSRHLVSMAMVHHLRHEHTGDPACLAEATALAREYLATTPTADPVPLSVLLPVLWRGYENGCDGADLRSATDAIARVRASFVPPPWRALVALNLIAALTCAFDQFGRVEDLSEMVDVCRTAMAGEPASSTYRPALLGALCVALRMRHLHTGDETALDDAITAGRAAVAAAPGHRALPVCLTGLAAALATRYETGSDRALLDEAVEIAQQALVVLPPQHPEAFKMMLNLSALFRLEHQRTGDLSTVDRAVERARAAVTAVPAGNRRRPAALVALAVCLHGRYLRTGDLAALEEARAAATEAVGATPESEPTRGGKLSRLALILNTYAGRTARPDVLRDAVRTAREALRLSRRDPAELSNLADALIDLFENTRDQDALDEAVRLARQAVALTPPDHRSRPARLRVLSSALADLHGLTGRAAPIHESVDLAREALARSRADDPGRPAYLNALGQRLGALHRLTGQPELLDEAIALGRLALTGVPADHPFRVRCLLTFSTLLAAMRVTPEGELVAGENLDTAIALLREALAATSDDDPRRPDILAELGRLLRDRHAYGAGAHILREAARTARQALAEATGADRRFHLATLGNTLLRQHLLTGRGHLLDEATSVLRDVVAQVDRDDPRWAQAMVDLGHALRARAERAGRIRAAAPAIETFRAAAQAKSGPPAVRVHAAANWAELAAASRRWRSAAEGYDLAVELLGRVAPVHLRRFEQTVQLAGFAGLAADAAATALYRHAPARAVELLEQGRGLLLAQALDAQAGLAELRRLDPELAERFTWLRGGHEPVPADAGDLPGDLPNELVRASHTAQRRHALAEEWGRVVARIRARPGYEDFLRPPACADLLTHATDGPIALLNISRYRSDALVLTNRGVRVVHLPDARPDAVLRAVTWYVDALPEIAAGDADAELTDLLGWLWDAITGPVLDDLGYTARPEIGALWPRIWWAPTGLLSLLPLHAAGHHEARGAAVPPTVLDRVVSSFTPTVRALGYARQRLSDPRPVPDRTALPKLLVVSLPDTHGLPDSELPGAAAETELLSELFPEATVLTGERASRAPVLAALPSHPWVHFACHSRTDPTGRSDGQLLLHDHATNPLTVSEVSRRDLGGARFAYLSACDTARADELLPDEAVPVATAFLLAGFGSVVGTLWGIDDDVAAQATRSVYTSMVRSTAADPRRAAAALHSATLRARAEYPDEPSTWAAHVHVGA